MCRKNPALKLINFLSKKMNNKIIKQFLFLVVSVASFALIPAHAIAENAFPAKPIKFIVPYPPGGPLDIIARLTGQQVSQRLGQPVIIDNKPGAGGNLGADFVAKSAADGYTILMGAVATHAINPTLYKKMPYDAAKDFMPITLLVSTPNVLVVNPSVKARTVTELIALAKREPGKLNFGSGSNGSAGHLAGELFKSMAGVDMTHVPYKGSAPALQDLLAGQIQLMFDNLASAMPQIKAGKLAALAVTTSKRSAFAPDLPTVAESGGAALAGFDISTWFGVFAPAGTPKEIIAVLNQEFNRAIRLNEVKEKLDGMGAEAVGTTPDAFAAYIKSEASKYADVIKKSGAQVD
jgi:tripartite-type tricarboxylate transporter receptor subunit TctC